MTPGTFSLLNINLVQTVSCMVDYFDYEFLPESSNAPSFDAISDFEISQKICEKILAFGEKLLKTGTMDCNKHVK